MKSKNNLLNGATIYLAGPIDRANDDGLGWRQEIKQKLAHVGITFFDPTHKPNDKNSETKVEKHYVNTLKEEGRFDELTTFVKQLRRIDLRMCDLSNAVIVYIDPDVHMFGTIDEIVTVERQQKPILAIVKGGKKRASGWAFAIVNHNEMFDSIDECVDYVEQLNSGAISLDSRWIIL